MSGRICSLFKSSQAPETVARESLDVRERLDVADWIPTTSRSSRQSREAIVRADSSHLWFNVAAESEDNTGVDRLGPSADNRRRVLFLARFQFAYISNPVYVTHDATTIPWGLTNDLLRGRVPRFSLDALANIARRLAGACMWSLK